MKSWVKKWNKSFAHKRIRIQWVALHKIMSVMLLLDFHETSKSVNTECKTKGHMFGKRMYARREY